MRDAGVGQDVALSEPRHDGVQGPQPMPLIVAMPLIAGLSIALWLGLSRMVCAAVGL